MSEALAIRKQEYQTYVEQMTSRVAAALPISVRDEDLKRARANMRVAFSADAQGALLDCTGESIARAIVLSAMTGLMPGGPKPDVWLIPRRNKHRGDALEVNWQISFRGFIRLARRAGWDLEPVLVFEGERFEIEEGSRPHLVHVVNPDAPRTWNSIRYGYVRVFREGRRDLAKIGFLTKEQLKQRRAKAKDQGVWNEWPLEMALKALCNYAGNREMFQLDDPARYAVDASERAELGRPARAELTVAQPAALPPAEGGDVIDADSWGPTGELVDLAEPEDTTQLLDDIQAAMKARFPEGSKVSDKADALRTAFGQFKWDLIKAMSADQLRVGLEALKTYLSGMASMREPGQDPGTEE